MRRNNEKKSPAPARANAAINGSAPRGYAAQIALSTPVPGLGALILDAGEWALSAIYHLITNQGTAAIEARCDTAIDADLIITRADLPTQAQANPQFNRADSRRVFIPSRLDDRGRKSAESTKQCLILGLIPLFTPSIRRGSCSQTRVNPMTETETERA